MLKLFKGAKRKVMLLLGLLVLASSVLSATPAMSQAANPNELEQLRQYQQQLDQQKQQITQERDRLKGIETKAGKDLTKIQSNLKKTEVKLQFTDAQLQSATTNLTQLEKALTKAEANYQSKQSATIARLKVLQRQRGAQGWAVLLQSHSFNDFLSRRRQLKAIYAQDRQSLVALQKVSDQLADQRARVENQKNEIALMNQQLLAQRNDFQTQAVGQKDLISRLKTNRAALEQAEAQLAQDSQAVKGLIQQRIGQGGWVGQGTGQMMAPVMAEITSGFGWRTHPILGYEKFHAGLDFGADYGVVISAADTGLVIFSGWYGGYGNSVILDHGNNITTLYAHADEAYVVEGQMVQKGQPIAAVGSTGLSTGPHLHFEVRQGGEPVDPVAFL
jgi:murein DD-endopeptidase MepM/ murein hydrolase activator NlpD